jgi:ribosomal protein S18 acetylase RimI-like enzyme
MLAVLAARESADLGRPECTLADLCDEWRGTDFDLAADELVAETDDGQIVGYAVTGHPGPGLWCPRGTRDEGSAPLCCRGPSKEIASAAASFADNLDYSPESLVALREEHLHPHDFEAGLSAVAQSGDVPVGFLLARRWQMENAGFVDLLGVHPQVRRRGLGRALLTAAFSRFAAAGLRTAQLGVASDNPRAISLYERGGMTPLFRIDTYERWESARSD